MERLSQAIGETIPMECQDWASTKAAYYEKIPLHDFAG
jgi:hypothetical protein